MNRKDFLAFERWFSEYVNSYYKGDRIYDETIALKEAHTKRVRANACRLGTALRLSAQDLLLCESAALFHDVGRFEQFARYGTFEDAVSENHAMLGLRELGKHGVLSRCEKKETAAICSMIGYHNRRSLPQKGDHSILFFSKILRDADKLDIWNIFVAYYEGGLCAGNDAVVWGLPDEPVVSFKILEALNRSEMADVRYMETLSDYKLLQISWIFDLNFITSLKEVLRRRYVERIAAMLPRSEQVEEALEKVWSYLNRQQEKTDQPGGIISVAS